MVRYASPCCVYDATTRKRTFSYKYKDAKGSRTIIVRNGGAHTLSALHNLRETKQFCDVVFKVSCLSIQLVKSSIQDRCVLSHSQGIKPTLVLSQSQHGVS